MELPCERCIWGIVPMIKKEIVTRLHDDKGMSKKDISDRLSISKSSICLYFQNERGKGSDKLKKDKKINLMIDAYVDKVYNNSNKDLVADFCEICRVVQAKF